MKLDKGGDWKVIQSWMGSVLVNLNMKGAFIGHRWGNPPGSAQPQNVKISELQTAAAKALQSCLTLCNPIDGSPPGSSIPGILQTRTMEWAAISFSNAWKCSVVSDYSWPHGLQPTRLLRPWDFPGKSTGVGCHCLLQNYRLKGHS